jgi:hypothetical protein
VESQRLNLRYFLKLIAWELPGSWLDSSRLTTYADRAVKQPIINVEEKIDRIVGNRTKPPDGLSILTSTRADAIAWAKALGGMRIPRGVYRFKTHEEADQWLWRMMARPTS